MAPPQRGPHDYEGIKGWKKSDPKDPIFWQSSLGVSPEHINSTAVDEIYVENSGKKSFIFILG